MLEPRESDAIIVIVDDDASAREGLRNMRADSLPDLVRMSESLGIRFRQ